MIYFLVPVFILLILLCMVLFGTVAGGFIACFGFGSLSLLLLGVALRGNK